MANSPYVDQGPHAIASRWREVATHVFTSSDSAGTSSYNLEALFNNVAFEQAIRTFRYFRFSKIQWRIQYVAMPNIYGAFFVNTLPDSGKGFNPLYYMMQADDQVMADIATQQEIILESPWIGNCDWIDTLYDGLSAKLQSDYRINFVTQGATVKSTQSSSVTAVPCIVFARMVDPQFAGPISKDSILRRVEFQMEKMGATELPLTEADLGTLPRIGNALGGIATAAVTGVVGQIMYNTFTGNLFPQTDTIANFQPSSVELGPPIIDLGKVVNATLNSPTLTPSGTDQKDDVRVNPFGSPTPKMLSHLDQHMFAGTHARIKIADWIKVPFYELVQRLPNDVDTAIVIRTDCDPTSTGRAGYLALAYKKYRGSLNIHYCVVLPALISAKYLLIVSYRGVPISNPGTILVGDEITKEINCRGTTTGTITIPYLSPRTFSSTCWSTSLPNPGNTPRIYLKTLLPPSYQGDVAPFVNMYVWTSPGKDFELVGRRDINPMPGGEPDGSKGKKVEFQMKVCEFAGVSDAVFDSRITPVRGMTYFEDILFRYSPVGDVYPKMSWPVTSVGTASTMFDWVGAIFKFWTGTYFLKSVLNAQVSFDAYAGLFLSDGSYSFYDLVAAPLFDRTNDGFSIINSEQTRTFEVTVPYQSDNSLALVTPSTGDASVYFDGFYSSFAQRPYRLELRGNTGDAENALHSYMSCGPDFAFTLSFPPPPQGTWPPFRVLPETETIGVVSPIDTQDTESFETSFSETQSCSL